MTRLWLLMFSLVVEELFRFFPNYSEANICDYKQPENGYGFLFSDMVVSPEYYVFIVGTYISRISVAAVLWYTWSMHRVAMYIFLVLIIVDLVDFCLTFSTPWFGPFPTFNHFKIAIFGLSMIYEKWKNY